MKKNQRSNLLHEPDDDACPKKDKRTMYIYIYIHTHTHTHTHIYIYIGESDSLVN